MSVVFHLIWKTLTMSTFMGTAISPLFVSSVTVINFTKCLHARQIDKWWTKLFPDFKDCFKNLSNPQLELNCQVALNVLRRTNLKPQVADSENKIAITLLVFQRTQQKLFDQFKWVVNQDKLTSFFKCHFNRAGLPSYTSRHFHYVCCWWWCCCWCCC